jgi:hypothetical protein
MQFQKVVIFPDRTRDALAVAHIIEINDDDRKDSHSMRIVLDLKPDGITQCVQAGSRIRDMDSTRV